MNTYKEQFASWQPTYPAIVHDGKFEHDFFALKSCLSQTTKTHDITIKAIKKAMEL